MTEVDGRSGVSSHRCGGICCQRFYINRSPQCIGEEYLAAKARIDAGEEEPSDRDNVTIAEMIVPLHEEGDEDPQYTCKNLDVAARLCTIYAERPKMCSQYPDYGHGHSCQYCGFKNPPCSTDETTTEAV